MHCCASARVNRMIKPTDILKQEHDGMRAMLRILQNVCDGAEARGSIDSGDFEAILDFFADFVTRCHQPKEEDVLFAALVHGGMNNEGGPVHLLLEEHARGREHVDAMRNFFLSYRAGNTMSLHGILAHGRDFIMLLEEHIEKEDGVLFPIADKLLSREHQDMIVSRFGGGGQDRAGAPRREALDALLDGLRGKYIS